MSEIAIRAVGLGKRYHIGALREERYPTLRDRLVGAVTAPFRRAWSLLHGHATGAAELDQVIWALRDASFEVRRGEVVGFIGRNGAGKSTLLKVLSRITEPTEGYADIYGRVGSLLEVGTGFHPELTGRENVFLNGSILGMPGAEIRRKFAEIVEFAEIARFIDTPVKHYSSGMYVRLAFAVAAHLEPEILIVDEVLSVGDAAFQQKCLGKMDDVASHGRTVLFVSHNMAAVNRLCERAVWLEGGRVHDSGPPKEVISAYLATDSVLGGERRWENGVARDGVEDFRVDAIRVLDARGVMAGRLDAREPFTVEIEFRVLERLPPSRVGFLMRTADGLTVFDAYDCDDDRYAAAREPGMYTARCEVPGHLLSPGRYIIALNAGIPRTRNLANEQAALAIDIVGLGSVGSRTAAWGRDGIVRPPLRWERERSAAPVGSADPDESAAAAGELRTG